MAAVGLLSLAVAADAGDMMMKKTAHGSPVGMGGRSEGLGRTSGDFKIPLKH